MIGTTVGKYRIVDKLGRGGMGTVYKAVDQTLDREVAIKVLNPDLTDADVLKRFRGEAVTLARLNHPGIATIYELHHQQDDELLMVMEFVRGETFHDLSDRLGPLAPPQAAHLCMQVLDALGHAHRGGVVHRDLKPANLMITDGGAVKVMDFGIARVLGSEHFTHGGYMMGTPAYMAPEQVLGREIDGRADLYSVGVVLYRLLSGRLPFNADTAISMVQMQISEAPTPISTFRPDLPNWCTAIVDRALAKSPSDRFQSAEEFRAALISAVTPQALGEMPTLATPTPPGLARDLDPELTVLHRTPTPMRTSSSIPSTPALPASATRPATPVSPSRPAVAPARKPTNTPLPEKTTTLVLGRTHLMALAALLVIVASGIGILAFAAFRGARSSAGSQAAATESVPSTLPAPPPVVETPTTAVPSSPPATVPPPAATPPVSATPTAPVTQKTLAAGGATVGQPPTTTGERGVATAGAGPSAAKTAGRGATSGVLPGGSPIDPARGGRAANPKDIVPPTPPPSPSAPAVPVAPPVTFNQVRMLVAEGERAREREGMLQIGDGRISVVIPGGNAPIMSLATSSLSAIFYSRSKQPKWRDASGQIVESKIDLGRMGFLRGERNWIILLTSGEPVILRIEDSALRTVLPALQERTGQQIQR
jgi:eukaryotic-like serine/threonine-protein kinase